MPNPSLKSDKIATVDPINETLHFMPIRRLTGESIRDAMLMVSGSLNESHSNGGSVPTHRTEFMTGRELGVWATRWKWTAKYLPIRLP